MSVGLKCLDERRTTNGRMDERANDEPQTKNTSDEPEQKESKDDRNPIKMGQNNEQKHHLLFLTSDD